MILYDRRLRKPSYVRSLRIGVSRDDPNLENTASKDRKEHQQQPVATAASSSRPSADLFDNGKFSYRICCAHVIDNFTVAPQFSRRLEELDSAARYRFLEDNSNSLLGRTTHLHHSSSALSESGGISRVHSARSRPGSFASTSARRPVSAFTNASHQLHDDDDGDGHNRRHCSRRETPLPVSGIIDDDDDDDGGGDMDASFEAIVQKHQQQQQQNGHHHHQQQKRPFSSPPATSTVIAAYNPHQPPLEFTEEFIEATGLARPPAQQYTVHRRNTASTLTDEILQKRRETSMITVPMRRPYTASTMRIGGAASSSSSSAMMKKNVFLTESGGGVATQVGTARLRRGAALMEAGSASSSHNGTPTILTKSMIFMHAAAMMNKNKNNSSSKEEDDAASTSRCSTARTASCRNNNKNSMSSINVDDLTEEELHLLEEEIAEDEQKQRGERFQHLSRGQHLGYSDVLSQLQVDAAHRNFSLTVQSHLDAGGEKQRPLRFGKQFRRHGASDSGGDSPLRRARSASPKRTTTRDRYDEDEDDDGGFVAPSLLDLRPDVVIVPAKNCVLSGTKIPITAEEKIKAAMESGLVVGNSSNSRPGTPVIFTSNEGHHRTISPSPASGSSSSPRRTLPATSSFDIKHHQQKQFQPRPPSRSQQQQQQAPRPSSAKIPAPPPKPLHDSAILAADDDTTAAASLPTKAAAATTAPSPLAASGVLSATTNSATSTTARGASSSTTLSTSLSGSLKKNTWLADGALSTSQIYGKKKAAVFHNESPRKSSAMPTRSTSRASSVDGGAAAAAAASASAAAAAPAMTTTTAAAGVSTNRIVSPRELREQRLNSARGQHYLNRNQKSGGQRPSDDPSALLSGLVGTSAVSARPKAAIDTLPK